MSLFTLCWCCSKATGGCSWSDHLKPVKGWTAKPTTINSRTGDSYMIYACPEFKQDAVEGGNKRYKGE